MSLAGALRKFADALDAYPELGQSDAGKVLSFWASTPQEVGGKLRALLSLGQVTKREFGSAKEYFEFSIVIGPLKVELCMSKSNLGCSKVKVMREVEEWQCPDSIVEATMQGEVASEEAS